MPRSGRAPWNNTFNTPPPLQCTGCRSAPQSRHGAPRRSDCRSMGLQHTGQHLNGSTPQAAPTRESSPSQTMPLPTLPHPDRPPVQRYCPGCLLLLPTGRVPLLLQTHRMRSRGQPVQHQRPQTLHLADVDVAAACTRRANGAASGQPQPLGMQPALGAITPASQTPHPTPCSSPERAKATAAAGGRRPKAAAKPSRSRCRWWLAKGRAAGSGLGWLAKGRAA